MAYDVIWGYTTRIFYKELNTLLRAQGLTDKTLAITHLLVSGLTRLPEYDGPVFREIQLEGLALEEYLILHIKGYSVGCRHFISSGSTFGAANRNKTGKNVVEYYTRMKAYDISEIADGIRYRGYPRLELLAFPPKRFYINERRFVEPEKAHYISMTEIELG